MLDLVKEVAQTRDQGRKQHRPRKDKGAAQWKWYLPRGEKTGQRCYKYCQKRWRWWSWKKQHRLRKEVQQWAAG